MELFDSSIPIASASLAAFIPFAEIITLVASEMKFALSSQKGLPTHSKWSYVIFDTWKMFWILDSVHDICENVTRRSVMI